MVWIQVSNPIKWCWTNPTLVLNFKAQIYPQNFSFLSCFFYFLLDLTGCLFNQHCVAEPFLSALGSEILTCRLEPSAPDKKATIRPYPRKPRILKSLTSKIAQFFGKNCHKQRLFFNCKPELHQKFISCFKNLKNMVGSSTLVRRIKDSCLLACCCSVF